MGKSHESGSRSYTGANKGSRPEYEQAAQAVGKELVVRGWGLVYGGGHTGLMGVLADTVLAEGGEVIGVMPRAVIPQEIAHQGLTTFYEVKACQCFSDEKIRRTI